MQINTRRTLAAAIGGWLISALPAGAALVNLSFSATGGGILNDPPPTPTIGQGNAPGIPGIRDGNQWDWLGPANSPRVNVPASQLGAYMTWNTPQPVRTLRYFHDLFTVGVQLDHIILDTLVGAAAGAGDNSNWVQRFDSRFDTFDGSADNAGVLRFLDIDLGATYSTQGVRVRAFATGSDQVVGEVAVISPLAVPGTMTDNRIAPSGPAVASSSGFGQVGAGATDDRFFNRWLSGTPAANPGDVYTLDIPYDGTVEMTDVSIIFGSQGNFSEIPTTFLIQRALGGGLYETIATVDTTATPGRAMYFVHLGPQYNVAGLRLLVEESAVTNGVAVFEFEAFNLPEPGAAIATAGVAVLTFSRRRR
jgi:hypothetical protein